MVYLEHAFHFLLVPNEDDATVFAGNALDLCHDRVDNSRFERISATVCPVTARTAMKHVRLNL